MKQRVKVFTHVAGQGTAAAEPPLEEAINRWLEATPGKVVRITQSESELPGLGHRVTISIWYVPGDVEPDFQIPF